MKQVFERLSCILQCAAFCLASAVANATPTISDLKVTSVEPIGVAIDYTVSGAEEVDAMRPVMVSMTAGGVTYAAKNLVGATNCVNGVHRVYWHMAEDGLTLDVANAAVTVTYRHLPTDGALYCIIDLSGGPTAESYPVTYLDSEPSETFTNVIYKTTKLVLKRVEAGTFIMGEDQTNEAHRVTLTKPFYMGIYEVTQMQWYQVMGSNSSVFSGDANPVDRVSYEKIRGSTLLPTPTNDLDSATFLGKLRAKTDNLLFDLPTEAQWEYTCRAGTTTTYSYGERENGAYMWYISNSLDGTHEVGTKLPNAWGFYDMHGNVAEWCMDYYWYEEPLAYGVDPIGWWQEKDCGDFITYSSEVITRGGGWVTGACTCAERSYAYDDYPRDSTQFYRCYYGFRLSRTIP